jgi:CRISPR/Cas system-associated endoribonuclease Cas2
MEEDRMERMKRELLSIINRKRDSLFIYPLCEKCSQNALTDGEGSLIRISSFEIL